MQQVMWSGVECCYKDKMGYSDKHSLSILCLRVNSQVILSKGGFAANFVGELH